jgi:hypothetical protein
MPFAVLVCQPSNFQDSKNLPATARANGTWVCSASRTVSPMAVSPHLAADPRKHRQMIGLTNRLVQVSQHRTPCHVVRSHLFILPHRADPLLALSFSYHLPTHFLRLLKGTSAPQVEPHDVRFPQSWLSEPCLSLSRHYSSHSLQSQHPLRALLEALGARIHTVVALGRVRNRDLDAMAPGSILTQFQGYKISNITSLFTRFLQLSLGFS